VSEVPQQARRVPLLVERDTAVHQSDRIWRRGGWQANQHRVAIALGLLAALAGAWLGLSGTGPVVGLDQGGYRVGSEILSPTGASTYAGSGAVVISHASAQTVAGGSAVVRGKAVRGVCAMQDDGLKAHCLFFIGSSSVTCVDTKKGGEWERRYDTGQTARIPLAGGRSVPVPFAIGFPL
jgi:hypothetical protein